MKSISAFLCILFTVLLVADQSCARKDTGDYWKSVMKDQAMPEAIRDVLFYHVQDVPSDLQGSSGKTHRFARNFDNRPNVIIYHSQMKPEEEKFETKCEEEHKVIKQVARG
ncbi:hypothetical protein FNV43_RR22690 [Rhamnella rubrinervis]|uniref:Uncharacterized protein n=1 Tax=Rhamnella rubrinervis TaxID=2594499 RepID=A0A8K0DWN0_9ROSA|nr:hypothetical protein FNV43_RR22690 [Rhamnella rubrinervis]